MIISVEVCAEELMISPVRTEFHGWTIIAIVHRLRHGELLCWRWMCSRVEAGYQATEVRLSDGATSALIRSVVERKA